MNLINRFETWDPFEELNLVRNRLNRAMSRYSEPGEEFLSTAGWTPVADVVETKDSIIVKAELPGVDEKDISVQIENGVLTLQGERKMEKKTEEKDYRRIERSYGKFLRAFTLTPTVEPKDITAAFENGILEVRIPKKEEAKPKSIKVDVRKRLSSAA
jgi:HSP20 family protein